MKKGIKLELYRAFYNPGFLLAILAGCIIAGAHFFHQVLPKTAMIFSGYNIDYPVNLFNSMLPLDYVSFYGSIYYYAVPLLAVLPSGVSYYQDLKSGYRKNLCIRMDKKAYLAGKYLAVFLSAGVVCVVPLLFNLMLTSAVLPALTPQKGTNLFAIIESSFLAELFYTKPFLYLLLYLLVDFVMTGTLACVALGISAFVRNRYIVLFAPFLLFFLLQAVSEYTGYRGWNPYNIMNPVDSGVVTGMHVLMEAGAFLLIGGGSFILGGGRKDVL